MTKDEMIAHSMRAVKKVDSSGQRGAMQVTTEEITALCLMVVLSGQIPAFDGVAKHAMEIMKTGAA
jgi:hypothetical protein